MHRGEAMMSLAWLVIFEQAELNQFPGGWVGQKELVSV
jgi:hypothetical protein